MAPRPPPSRCASLAVAALGALATLSCNRLFYYPSRALYTVPDHDYDTVQLQTPDGVALHGWLIKPDSNAAFVGTVVQFHGNAGNISSHHRGLEWLVERGYALLAIDYRGYGRSSGRPTPHGLRTDVVTTIEWAQRNAPRGGEQDLILYGQSLGGAVLLDALPHLRERSRLRAVVVEGTFHSYQDVAAGVMWRHAILLPFAGLGYALVSDEFAPAASIAQVSPIPLLVIHDARDPIVPVGFGTAVYDLAQHPKTFWVTDTGHHIRATDDPAVRSALLAWFRAPPTKQRRTPE